MSELYVGVLIGIAIACVSMAILVQVFEPGSTRKLRDEAIQHKAAEWRCDPITGEKTLVWLSRQTESKP